MDRDNSKIHSYLQVDKLNYRSISRKDEFMSSEAQVRPHPADSRMRIIEFEDTQTLHVKFKPLFTPKQLLQMGIFGGLYFGSIQEDSNYWVGKEAADKLPKDWFEDVYCSETKPSWKDNYFGVKAGLDAEWWHERSLICDIDKLGWFEWYCHYFLGRRIPAADKRQIIRWANFRDRHTPMALSQASLNSSTPKEVSPRYRQSLLQWAVNPWPDIIGV